MASSSPESQPATTTADDAPQSPILSSQAAELDDDDDTIAILDSSSSSSHQHSSSGGLCGALPDGACIPLTKVHMKERITDLKQKGGGILSKLRKRSSTSFSSQASSLYDPSLYLCSGAENDVVDDDDDDDLGSSSNKKINYEEEPIPASVIGNPNRTVCVITTAALPWRTGTAVNPLLRALYLLRFQNEKKLLLQKKQRKEEGIAAPSKSDETNGKNRHDNNHRGSVALVIPWLESQDDRRKLYGTQNTFSNGPQGMKEQEEWIRSYSSERCGMPREAKELRMIFYPAFYLAGFGSIFPKVDLCNFIPRELVDVAILEEPEHLNWFRMPNSKEESKRCLSNTMDGDEDDAGSEEQSGGDDESTTPSSVGESGVLGQKVEVTINESPSNDIAEVLEKPTAAAATNVTANPVEDVANENESSQRSSKQQPQQASNKKYIEKSKLGWTHRFNFVVGIVHTNYEAYARQYGIGASLIAGPAIGAMSALAIRAYCHEVIKLSDTLPNFAPGKEVTCNVHGVRSEFLEGVDLNVLASSSTGVDSKQDQQHGVAKNDDKNADDAPSPVYFIGKLVWAKGFDLMLELQDIFRKRKNNGEYFHIDIYGGGPDEKAIARAFHGRSHPSPTRRPPPSPSTNKDASPNTVVADPKALNAAMVLTNPQSIKDQSSQVIEQMKQQQRSRSSLPTTDGGVEDVVVQYLSLGFEVSQMNGSATYFQESRGRLVEGADERSTSAPSASLSLSNKNAKNPLDILGDLSGKSFDTGVKTSQAVYNIADSSIKNILTMSFSQLKHPLKHRRNNEDKEAAMKQGEKTLEGEEDKQQQPHFVFDPPVSRYEWRRHPIPAKFPGVIDHAQLKNIAHKIFLNPSTSEVLCTTTAEALAMNKFVIIPKHPSNEFFVQFTNCLSYDTLEECADKMAWALENTPTPLSEEERRKFTWEAATERLMESSIVTVKQARERAENGMDKTDARIAYWLSESGEKSNMIRNLFHKNGGGSGGDNLPLVDLGVVL